MNFNYMSRNVPNPAVYRGIYDLRRSYKQKMKREKELNGYTDLYYDYHAKQEALKLILNTTYGAMKNEYNALYDPQQASSVCYLGQLLLAALANNLYNNVDCKIIQSNTDGLLIKVKNDKVNDLKNLVSEWEEMTGFSMEYDYIQTFYQRDVNNYIEVPLGVKDIKDLKVKGKWTNQENYDPTDRRRKLTNLNAPITHNAILNYYVFGTPIDETINECDDVYAFCFTCKTGYTYDKTYYVYDDEYRIANKVNRVVATTDERCGTLYKYKSPAEGKNARYDKIAEIPQRCLLMNGELTIPDTLDRQWYVDFAKNKLEDLVEI